MQARLKVTVQVGDMAQSLVDMPPAVLMSVACQMLHIVWNEHGGTQETRNQRLEAWLAGLGEDLRKSGVRRERIRAFCDAAMGLKVTDGKG